MLVDGYVDNRVTLCWLMVVLAVTDCVGAVLTAVLMFLVDERVG